MRLEGKRKRGAILFLIVIFGLFLRVSGIFGNGYPQSYYPDEINNVERSVNFYGEDGFDLNPHWFNKPALGYYITFGEFGFYYLWRKHVRGDLDSAQGFANGFLNYERGDFYAIARLFTCIFGAITILLTYRMGKAIFNRQVGLWAAFLLALCPGHVIWCQVVKFDVLAAMFNCFATLWMVSIYNKGRKRDYAMAGMWIGLSFATKYLGVVLFIPLVLAHFLRRHKPETAAGLRPWHGLKMVGLSFAAMIGAAFIGSPYNFLDDDFRQTRLKSLYNYIVGARFGAGDTTEATTILSQTWWACERVFDSPGFGPILSILALVGAVLAWRCESKTPARRQSIRILAVTIVSYLLLVTIGNEQRPRPNHVMAFYPWFACFAALTMEALRRFLVGKFPKIGAAKVAAVVGMLILIPAPGFPLAANLQNYRQLNLAHPYTLTHNWIQNHIASHESLVIDGEFLPGLKPDQERQQWHLDRGAMELRRYKDREEVLLKQDVQDAKVSAELRFLAGKIEFWTRQNRRLLWESRAVQSYLGRRYDLMAVLKPWHSYAGRQKIAAYSGYNTTWDVYPLPHLHQEPEIAVPELAPLPPVERYRVPVDQLKQLSVPILVQSYPVLAGKPIRFWVVSESSYNNFVPERQLNRERHPEWAAFYDDLKNHYDCWEIPQSKGASKPGMEHWRRHWRVRIYDLRLRRPTGQAEVRAVPLKDCQR